MEIDDIKRDLHKEDTLETVCILGGFSAGAIRGFCDAKNIPINFEGMESLLMWGPGIAGGAIASTHFGVFGIKFGAKKAYEECGRIRDAVFGATLGGVLGIGLGAVTGALEGFLFTAVGYGTGYVCGKML